MALTFGLTGMDPATEAALRSVFEDANKRVGGTWQLQPDTQADFVVVDMDSMYGPMSWLRLHGAGKTVIGLTSAPRTQTNFRLSNPFDVESVAALLQDLAGGVAVPAPGPAEPVAAPAGITPAPQPQDRLPEEQPRRVDEEVRAPAEPTAAVPTPSPLQPDDREPPSAAAGRTVPAAPSIDVPLPSAWAEPAAPAPPPPAPAPVEPSTVAEWLGTGRVRGKVRLERAGQSILIDADARQYYGPAALKPLASALEGDTALDDFKPVPAAEWSAATAKAGEAHPLPRLLWYAALVTGRGVLAPGFDADGRYQMLKWPQTEREFPKHFRIATAMMKGPSTLTEIAEASGVPLPDVTDFVSANLATGFAEPFREPEPEPEPTKSGGLFGRLRGR